MKIGRLLTGLVLAVSCSSAGRPGTPPEFPFPVALPRSVMTQGLVTREGAGTHEFVVQDRSEVVRGRKWTGHVRVDGYGARDRTFLASLERALIERTGWEPVYRDESRDPPIATLRRTLGGEILWISLEGWPDDVTVTLVHRD